MNREDWHRCSECDRWTPDTIGAPGQGCAMCSFSFGTEARQCPHPGLVPEGRAYVHHPWQGSHRGRLSAAIIGTLGLAAIPKLAHLRRQIEDQVSLGEELPRLRRGVLFYVLVPSLVLASVLRLTWGTGHLLAWGPWTEHPWLLAAAVVFVWVAGIHVLICTQLKPVWRYLETEQASLSHPEAATEEDLPSKAWPLVLALPAVGMAFLGGPWLGATLVGGILWLVFQISFAVTGTRTNLEIVWMAHAFGASAPSRQPGPSAGSPAADVTFEMVDGGSPRRDRSKSDSGDVG